MKFSDITPASDADRRLAESKKLTIQPIHPYVSPDEVSDEQIAAQHLVNPAIPNVPSDTEQDVAPLKPSQSALRDNSRADGKSIIATVVIFTAAAAVITGGVFLFIHIA